MGKFKFENNILTIEGNNDYNKRIDFINLNVKSFISYYSYYEEEKRLFLYDVSELKPLTESDITLETYINIVNELKKLIEDYILNINSFYVDFKHIYKNEIGNSYIYCPNFKFNTVNDLINCFNSFEKNEYIREKFVEKLKMFHVVTIDDLCSVLKSLEITKDTSFVNIGGNDFEEVSKDTFSWFDNKDIENEIISEKKKEKLKREISILNLILYIERKFGKKGLVYFSLSFIVIGMVISSTNII